MKVTCLMGAALAAMSSVSAAFAADIIRCEGTYRYHLQGVATDGTNVFWSFTTDLVKTDRSGRVLCKDTIQRTDGHMGDLCYKDGLLYVGMNRGKTKEGWRVGDEVWVYDAATLKLLKKHPTPETVWDNNGLEWCDGFFWVISGAPKMFECNMVFKYSPDFHFCEARLIDSGWTHLGVQTICKYRDLMLFGCYGTDKPKEKAHKSCTFVVDTKALTAPPSRERPGIIPIRKRFDSYTSGGMLVMDDRLWIACGRAVDKKLPKKDRRYHAWIVADTYTKDLQN